MKSEISLTIYSCRRSGSTPELWHADKWPQGTDGPIDLAHARKGLPITLRVTSGSETHVVRLTLDEALELRDALDMVRHRSYEPSEGLIARLKEGGKLSEDDIGKEMQHFDMALVTGIDGGLLDGLRKRKAWMTRKWEVLRNIIRRRACLE
jgi:hypothetical protein